MKTNLFIIKAFTCANRKKMKVGNLRIIDNCLYSWYTCIGEIIDNIIFINMTKYSKSTSTHVNVLLRNIPSYFIRVYVDNVPMGTCTLSTLDGSKIKNI